MTAGVLCAVRGPSESAVVRAVAGAGGRFEVVRRCADLAELLGAGAAGLGAVAVVSADLPGLDREAVHHLHGSGLRVVVLDTEGRPPGALAHLGADGVLHGADDVVDALETALAGPPAGQPGGAPAVGRVGGAPSLTSGDVAARLAGVAALP
ncbi:hypothetical protein ICW40_20440, partial [Actinotalea ferrariae]|nr:hypothetical protein [Actinotalea ferrariae]